MSELDKIKRIIELEEKRPGSLDVILRKMEAEINSLPQEPTNGDAEVKQRLINDIVSRALGPGFTKYLNDSDSNKTSKNKKRDRFGSK